MTNEAEGRTKSDNFARVVEAAARGVSTWLGENLDKIVCLGRGARQRDKIRLPLYRSKL